MMYNILVLFVLFLIYSFIGWFMEIITCSIEAKKIVDRGFLIGPYCPIYGVCSLLMMLFLKKYLSDPIALFVMATLICSIIEYLTSHIMEKMFKVRWWDYSHLKFNINGRICLQNSILFGLLGMFLMYVASPFFYRIILLVPKTLLIIISIILILIFMTDVCISFNVINKIKITANSMKKDYTEEITKIVRDTLKKTRLQKRLINAFPNIYVTNNKKKEDKYEK